MPAAAPRVALSLADCARPWALRSPQAVAIRHGERTLSFAGLIDRIDRIGNAVLDGIGLAPGSHAGIFSSNRLEYVELLLGLADARVAPVSLSPTLGPDELAFACGDSEIRTLFVEPALEELARAAVPDSVERIVVLGEEYERLLGDAHSGRPDVVRLDSDACSIRYTSGTTGTPKASVHSHRSRTIQNLSLASELGFASPRERSLALGSLSSGAGNLHAFAALMAGGAAVMLPIFHPEAVLRQIERHAVTAVTGTPTHLTAILELGEAAIRAHDMSSLRLISLIGAPPSQALKERIIEVFGHGILWEEYGSTEASIVARLGPDEHLRKPGSAGLPCYGNVLRIVDDDGLDVPSGDSGVLHVRSPILFDGYWGKPEETAAVFRDGWFVTGDIARIDDEGYLHILSRADDTIITGGLNVHPRQIEDVLLQHPAVANAGVYGVPDDRLGQAIRAAVVLREATGEDAASLAVYLARRLAREKQPRTIDVVDELPTNPGGKLDRRALRDRLS
ncbi:MAG TPA: AMP-binding protein [Gaiellaceae bacterium]